MSYSQYPQRPAQPYGYGPAGYPVGPGLQPLSPRQVAKTRREKRSTAFRYAFGYLAAIWTVFLVNFIFFGGYLNNLGIHPLDTSSFLGIFLAPLLHADIGHIVSNSVPGAIFCFLIGYSGSKVFWEVTAFSVFSAGLGTWLFGGIGTNHIGASGLVYGWLTYLIVRGIFNRSARQIFLGLVLGFFYSGLIWGIFPGTPGVSWQGHLFGALGGLLAGMIITSDDPPELVARRLQRQARRRPPGPAGPRGTI